MIAFLALACLAHGPLQADSLLPETPPDWRHERLDFPPAFAPELERRGIEDLAFAPGMFAPDSDSYFSYALAIRLEGEVEIDEAFLKGFLESYYRGLCRAVAAERKLERDSAAITAAVRRDGPRFRATISMFDPFVTGEPLELELELESHAAPRATELLGLASALDRAAPIWKDLHALGERWRAARPAPVFLNHVYLVPDRETYDALAGSDFLRESFAVSEERTTVRADRSYTGLYFYGQHTYVEFLQPGVGPADGSSSGLAFSIELAGGSAGLAQRLAGQAVPTQAFPITRALEEQQLPWFQLLGVEMPAAALSVFSLEYDPRFLASWHADLPPAAPGIARSLVLERYAAALDQTARRAEAPFADVIEVRLALDDPQRERLLALCAACGYEVEHGSDTWTCHGPQFRLVLQRSATPGGVTGLELSLRQPLEREPLRLGRALLEFHGRTASFLLER